MYEKNILSVYCETENVGNIYRSNYLTGIQQLIEKKREEGKEQRLNFANKIIENPEKCREELINMLGWPLNCEKEPILSVSKDMIFEDEQSVFYRMQFELFSGYQFYGILLQHKSDKELPMVISQHGGWGTPEMCSSFFDSANYNDMSLRIFNKGVNVFAPQLLLWQTERFGPDNQRNEIDNALKQIGGSITALEVYSIMRCIDYFEEQTYCDGRFGMAGLSYGGFYTLHTTAIDTRIKAALSSSHFHDRTKYISYDKVKFGEASTFMDAQLALLVCPRFLRIEVGDTDELFEASSGKEEFEIVNKLYYPRHNVQFHVFEGKHEFCPEDDGIDEMINKLMGK